MALRSRHTDVSLDELISRAIDGDDQVDAVPAVPDPPAPRDRDTPRVFLTPQEAEAWGLEMDQILGEAMAEVAQKYRDHGLHRQAVRCWPALPSTPPWAVVVDVSEEEMGEIVGGEQPT